MRILLPALALFLVSLSGLLAFAHYRWRAKSADFIARLTGDDPVSPPAGLSVVEFKGLPVPGGAVRRPLHALVGRQCDLE
jgi:hypothetical protein